MKIVLKIGGAALEDNGRVRAFARAVVTLAQQDVDVAVIHGGGAALTRTLGELGYESRFENGLRVTDARTRDVAVMVLAGHSNKRVVAAIDAAGVPAAGLCGSDLGLLRAVKKRTGTDLGFVGEVDAVDWRWIDLLWSAGAVPVIASIAPGDDGELYNINADEVAAACAVACHADALVFLTDVPGVRDQYGNVIPRLPASHIRDLSIAGVVSGGMIPKLDACMRALDGRVSSVRILPAARVEALPLIADGSLHEGTEVVLS
ncbi:MAG TPA: acetylglutamate kinase [Candidatus Krumholzibacteria bacterium]|nr:acetylglutamate kinase [Candidatus Krumholzibacteria bacterium]